MEKNSTPAPAPRIAPGLPAIDPAKTADRASLRAAQSALAAASDNLAAARKAAEAARENKWSAQAALQDIQDNATAAADDSSLAGKFLSLIQSGDGGDVATLQRSIADTKALEDAARRDIAVWTRTSKACEQAAKLAESALATAQNRVANAAAALIRNSGAAERLMEGLEAMQAEVIRRRVALRFLVFKDLVAEAHIARTQAILSNTALPGGLGSVERIDWNSHAEHVAWKEALEALTRDPDALLPN